MRTKVLVLFFIFLLSSCRHGESEGLCPRVVINREDSYLTQIVNYREEFQISIIGFDGYCYFDTRVNRTKAVIEPIFKIKRLRQSDESDVHFAYFTETVKGPPAYLGKKTYYLNVTIPENELETEYKAKAVEVKIPEDMKYEFDINLGLVMTKEEQKYNERTFDINYRYVNE